MTRELLVWMVGVTGFVSAIASALKAWYDRKTTRSKATLDDASATAVVTAAARELVDPLRKELADVRREHARDRQADRARLAELRRELEACTTEAEHLRGELAMARVDADELRRDRERYREKDRLQTSRIRDLERLLNQD